MPILRKPEDIASMRAACQAAAGALDYITPFVKAGITTGELDRLMRDYIDNVIHVKSATIGYGPPGHPPFPASICTSINHVVCHGIPGDKALKNGDIINIDITIIKDGWFGDTSRMYHIGQVSPLAQRLSDTAYECMWLGIAQVKPGNTLGDIGHAIQTHAQSRGYSVVRDYCGHGIGQVFHDEPMVLHYGKPKTGMKLVEGMTFTIEPMINAGHYATRIMPDQWTVVTKDRSLSAQWEHTVLVTADGFEVLTVSPGMPSPPAFIHA